MALLNAQTSPPIAPLGDNHTSWVASCLEDFESIKPGMTRGQIEAKFPKEGGIQGVSPVRFTHPACRLFKIDVDFDFKRDSADQGRAIIREADKVTKASKPYIGRPVLD